MFFENLNSIACWALVLLILSNFSFLSVGHSFSRASILLFEQECMSTLFNVRVQTSYAIPYKSMTENDCI